MFTLMKLEDRIVLDGAAPGELDRQDSDMDAVLALQADADDHDMASAEPLLTDGLAAHTAADPVRVLLISSDLADDEGLSNAAADNVLVLRYNADAADLKNLSAMIADALGGKQADSIAFAVHSTDEGGLQLTAKETVTSASLMQDIRPLSKVTIDI